MKKLRLNLDDITVESFATGRGGILRHDTTAATDCGPCDQGGSGQNWCPSAMGSCAGCTDSEFPCHSINACNTDANTCRTICPCTDITCPGGPDSCDPRCTMYGTCPGGGYTCGC